MTQVVGIYRQFKMINNRTQLESFKKQLNEITDFLQSNHDALIMGDFNLDFNKINVQNYVHRRLYDELIEITIAFDLTQLIKDITWSRVYQGEMRSSVLDHAYTNVKESIAEIVIEKQPISDHSAIILSTVGKTKIKKKIVYSYECWRNYTKEKLLEEIRTYDLWSLSTLSVQNIVDKLDQILGTIKDKLVPIKKITKPGKWADIPAHIIELKSKLKNLYKRAKKTKSVELHQRSRILEKKIRTEIKLSKTNKIRAEATLGPKNLWKAVKLAKGVTSTEIPPITVDSVTWTNNDEEVAEIMGKRFADKISELSSTTNVNYNQRPYDRKIYNNHEQNWITQEKVTNVMKNLPSKRCSGFDRIPLVFYKDGAEPLEPIITVLMKKIIEDKIIPEQWKVAKVTPIYKKGPKTSPDNYRPISNLCSITKIFEKLVLEQIKAIETLENCDLTGENQHGFKSKRSTDTCGLELQSHISTWCDDGEYVSMTSLDLSAAFDLVDHVLLVKRLRQVGLPIIIVDIIKIWLQNRSFYCDIRGTASFLRPITHGTVQGSILGPVLFAVFISGIYDSVENLTTYADDNFLLNHHKQKEVLIQNTVEGATSVIEWLESNGMIVNTDKTEICIFHIRDYQQCEIKLSGNSIKVSSSIKVLGVIFDSKLNWSEQVRHAVNKANKAKQGLALIRHYFNQEEMMKLTTAYFYSTLYYGSKIWLTSAISRQSKTMLWRVSSYMLRLIYGVQREGISFAELHKHFKRATPMMWGNYTTAQAMWEAVNIQSAKNITAKLTTNLLVEQRREGLLFTRSNKSKIGYNCLSNRLQVVSRRLHNSWQDMTRDSFKMLCKKTFIEEELIRI